MLERVIEQRRVLVVYDTEANDKVKPMTDYREDDIDVEAICDIDRAILLG